MSLTMFRLLVPWGCCCLLLAGLACLCKCVGLPGGDEGRTGGPARFVVTAAAALKTSGCLRLARSIVANSAPFGQRHDPAMGLRLPLPRARRRGANSGSSSPRPSDTPQRFSTSQLTLKAAPAPANTEGTGLFDATNGSRWPGMLDTIKDAYWLRTTSSHSDCH